MEVKVKSIVMLPVTIKRTVPKLMEMMIRKRRRKNDLTSSSISINDEFSIFFHNL